MDQEGKTSGKVSGLINSSQLDMRSVTCYNGSNVWYNVF